VNLDRRQFLVSLGAAAVASRTVLRGADALAAAADKSAAPDAVPWHQKIRRVGQLNFNERDPAELDVAAWADTWPSSRSMRC